MRIDLNADLGEGFGVWRLGDDDALLDVVTSANVACGFHAGDPVTMRRVCAGAAQRGVAIGAQVGYRDLAGFGRRRIDIDRDELAADVLYQLGALDACARAAGTRVRYVKPHGALYNTAVDDPEQAGAIASAVAAFDPTMPLLALPDSALATAAHDAGLPFVPEAFADRGYRPDGRLVPRGRARSGGRRPVRGRGPRRRLRPAPARDRRRRHRADGRGALAVRPRRHPGGGVPGHRDPAHPGRRRGHPGAVRAVRLRPYGDEAVLVEPDDPAATLALAEALRGEPRRARGRAGRAHRPRPARAARDLVRLGRRLDDIAAGLNPATAAGG